MEDKGLIIPSDYITDGCNIIHFVSDLWSPAEYGAEDKNTYGFSAGLVELRKITIDDNYFPIHSEHQIQ